MSSDAEKRSRRQFLSQTSLALAAAGVAGLGQPRPAAAKTTRAGAVIQRTLGRTGIELPIVNMGVMNANNPELVKQAYEAGVRLFDTAQGYQGGRNERMIGDVISKLGVRDKVLIQTKVRFPRVPEDEIRAAFLSEVAGCLERLQTSYIDIMMIHQPSVEQMNNPEALSALDELKRQKKARFIGVAQHAGQAGILKNAADTGIYDVVLVSFNITNAGDTDFLAALKTAAAKGVGIIAMKTQTGGRAKHLGALNHTALLKWVLQHPEFTTAVPGFTNSDQLNESFSVASGLEYTPEEKAWLADKNVRLALDFCKQCGTCLPTCPRGVDIPALMRTHMYAASYANFEQARTTFDEIPAQASLALCGDCSDCSARCGNNLGIAEKVADLKTMYA
jgi:uncharacterized protein